MAKNLHIGTSGWNYKHWRGVFYPHELQQKDWLAFYADHFETVEINNSFYQLPEKQTFRKWKDTVEGSFEFAVKGSRFITHMKKLKDPDEHVPLFLSRAEELGDRLGPILFQLPPRWKCNPERLEAFLKTLPKKRRFVMEFRDDSWYAPAVFDLLDAYDVGFCIHDMPGNPSPREAPSDLVYIRFHGSSDSKYQGEYGGRRLSGWAGAISSWLKQGKTVYCYFNNDPDGHAIADAKRLKEMLEK